MPSIGFTGRSILSVPGKVGVSESIMTIGEAGVDVEESRCATKGVIGSFGTGSARSKLGVASGEVQC